MSAATRPAYLATAATSGLLFGAGLYVSQMVDPYKVLRFLDFTLIPTGQWDPSVALVMAAGLAVMLIAVRFGKTRPAPLFDASFHEPEFQKIDLPLVAGATTFGIGWGMSGICPGPGIALVAFWPSDILVFLLALFAGSYAGSLVIPSGRSRRLAMAQ